MREQNILTSDFKLPKKVSKKPQGLCLDEANGFTTVGNFIIPTRQLDEYLKILQKAY